MPTKAATGTKHMKTTSKAPEPAEVDPQEGHYPRRNWTDEDGKVHHEERRPPSKQWIEVDVD